MRGHSNLAGVLRGCGCFWAVHLTSCNDNLLFRITAGAYRYCIGRTILLTIEDGNVTSGAGVSCVAAVKRRYCGVVRAFIAKRIRRPSA